MNNRRKYQECLVHHTGNTGERLKPKMMKDGGPSYALLEKVVGQVEQLELVQQEPLGVELGQPKGPHLRWMKLMRSWDHVQRFQRIRSVEQGKFPKVKQYPNSPVILKSDLDFLFFMVSYSLWKVVAVVIEDLVGA